MQDTENPSNRLLIIDRRIGTVIVGLALMALTLTFIVAALRLPPAYSPRDVGPAVFPLIASVATLLFVAAMMIGELRQREARPIVIDHPWLVAAGIALIGGYVILIPLLGTYVSTFLLVTGMTVALGTRRIATILMVNVLTLGLIYVGFELLLHVRFPRGLIL